MSFEDDLFTRENPIELRLKSLGSTVKSRLSSVKLRLNPTLSSKLPSKYAVVISALEKGDELSSRELCEIAGLKPGSLSMYLTTLRNLVKPHDYMISDR